MARIRTVKPEFFQHEGLYDAERESGLPLRVAFIGLWTVADKAGRFEWRPRQIKLNVLPYDDVDFAAVLSALEKHGFIQRYAVDDKVYGCIPSWDKHQHKNVREPDSTIPPPDWQVHAPDEAGARTCSEPAQAAGKGREGERNGNGNRKGVRACARETGGGVEAPPDGLDLQAWERWKAYRVEIRRPLKPASIPAAQKHLAAFGADQAAVVEQSIANGWQGLFPLKANGGGHGRPYRPAPTTAELEAQEAARGNG